MTTRDFKAHIAAIMRGLAADIPIYQPGKPSPIVRTKRDRGYYPPKQKQTAKSGSGLL